MSVLPAIVSRKQIIEFLEVRCAIDYDGLFCLHRNGNARHDALDVASPIKTLQKEIKVELHAEKEHGSFSK